MENTIDKGLLFSITSYLNINLSKNMLQKLWLKVSRERVQVVVNGNRKRRPLSCETLFVTYDSLSHVTIFHVNLVSQSPELTDDVTVRLEKNLYIHDLYGLNSMKIDAVTWH